MDVGSCDFEEQCRQLWLQGALDSSEACQRTMGLLVDESRACTLKLDYDRFLSLSQTANWAEPRCRVEPVQSTYEYGIGQMGAHVAAWATLLRQFDLAYLMIAAVMDLMVTGAHRRARLGEPFRGQSELWLGCVLSLSECKWQCGAAERNKLVSVEWLVDRYDALHERVNGWIAEHGDRANTRFILALTECSLVKTIAKFLPQQLTERIVQFNRRYGATLTIGPGHYRDGRPLGGYWYWDFEIAKLYIVDDLAVDDLDHCHKERMKAALRESFDSKVLHAGLELEVKWLREQLVGKGTVKH